MTTATLEVEASRIVKVSPEVHQQLKIAAAHEGRQMKQIVEDLIRAYLATKTYTIATQAPSN